MARGNDSPSSLLVVRPLPTANPRTVDSVLVSMASACNLAVAKLLFSMRPNPLQFRNAVNGIDGETEPVRLVVNCQFHRRIDIALLFVAADMQIPVVCAPIGETVNQPGIAMEVEDDQLVGRKQRIEISIRQAMWMFVARLQLEQVNHVNESDSQVRESFPKQCRRSQCFLGRDVAGCCKDHIGFVTFIIAGPIPDTDTLCAMRNGSVNIQVLQVALLVRDNDVDVVLRAQTMIGYGEQTVGIRRKINARNGGAFVKYYIQEARILVR